MNERIRDFPKGNQTRDIPETDAQTKKDLYKEVRSIKEKYEQHKQEATCYKSKLLNQYFDDYDKLIEAEVEYRRIHEAELKEKEEKKEKLARIDTLRDAYLQAVKEYNSLLAEATKKAQEAEKAWREAIGEFAREYGSYHMTYTNSNVPNDYIKSDDWFDNLMDRMFRW